MATETGKRGMQGDDRRQLLTFLLISLLFVVMCVLMGAYNIGSYGSRSSGTGAPPAATVAAP